MLPHGYVLTKSGLFFHETADDDGIKLCSPLEVPAKTRNFDSTGWGRLIAFSDSAGHEHQMIVPADLMMRPRKLLARLANGGLEIERGPGVAGLLEEYITESYPGRMVWHASKTGWCRSGLFVLPDRAISNGDHEEVIYQSEGPHKYTCAGTLEEWKQNVGRMCAGNSRLILGVSAAFASSLVYPLSAESGGFHFRGGSAIGKSTALLAAGSVWGGGDQSGFMESWQTTKNALEPMAAAHNDTLLILDEIGEKENATELGTAIYMLANGAGKRRYNGQHHYTWRLLFLSSGEISLRDYLASAGQRIHGGQEVRFIDVEADAGAGYGLFENLHGYPSAREFSDALKITARQHYGTPSIAFLKHVTKKANLMEEFKKFQGDFVAECLPKGAAAEVMRVASRFALVAAAGVLATKAGITGWGRDDAAEAAQTCFKTWLENRGTPTLSTDVQEGLGRVREFLRTHEGRFQDWNIKTVPRSRAGFKKTEKNKETWYFIFPDVFTGEVCVHRNYLAIARALEDRGLLSVTRGNGKQKTVRLPGYEYLSKVYAVNQRVLEE